MKEILLNKTKRQILFGKTPPILVAVFVFTAIPQHVIAQEIDLNKTMIENCDIDGNNQVYGRKAAKENKIDLTLAKKEFKCKMKYDLKESEKDLAEEKKREEESKKRLEEADKRLDKLDKLEKKALRELNDAMKN